MKIEEVAAEAISHCVDIYKDYDIEEVKRWAPKSVQAAWALGEKVARAERDRMKMRLKDFTL